MRVLPVRDRVIPRQSEVGDLDLVVGVDQNVVGFHVAVENAVVVEFLDAAQDLVHDHLSLVAYFDLQRRQEHVFVQTAQQFPQIEVDKLENQKN